MNSQQFSFVALLVLVAVGGCGRVDMDMVAQPVVMAAPQPMARQMAAPPEENRETFQAVVDNPIQSTVSEPLSTFSIDVDTASYALVRRDILNGQRPRQDAVRLEELVNYFDYSYPTPANLEQPLAVYSEVGPSPWNSDTYLVHIGIKAYEPATPTQLPPMNLVFLLDVSGSMSDDNKLPLVKSALPMLVNQLGARDRVSMVVYAGASGVVLPPTPGDQHQTIINALQQLDAGGSTNAGEGIDLAYRLARENYIADGLNRIVLVTDGDVNVGTTSFDALVEQVAHEREAGIHLNTLGVGMGDYRDDLLERLAVAGEGNHTYVDSLKEARRALVDHLASNFMVVASDVKVQVEFNPAQVDEYRLLGYSNRLLNAEDFVNDKVDAGEIGPGHTVTALYEIHLRGEPGAWLPPLRYQPASEPAAASSELAFVKVRYKPGKAGQSSEMASPIAKPAMERAAIKVSDDFEFSAAVAGFAQLLRNGTYLKSAGDHPYGLNEVVAAAIAGKGSDETGDRGEFLQLVKTYQALTAQP